MPGVLNYFVLFSSLQFLLGMMKISIMIDPIADVSIDRSIGTVWRRPLSWTIKIFIFFSQAKKKHLLEKKQAKLSPTNSKNEKKIYMMVIERHTN